MKWEELASMSVSSPISTSSEDRFKRASTSGLDLEIVYSGAALYWVFPAAQ